MKTFKKLSGLSATLLLTASMGTAYAEEGDMTQLRTQDRDRSELNLQTPNSDFGQTQNRDQQMVMNKNQQQNQNQYQNQYRDQNNFQTGRSDTGESSMNRQNMTNRSNAMGGSTRSMGGNSGGRR